MQLPDLGEEQSAHPVQIVTNVLDHELYPHDSSDLSAFQSGYGHLHACIAHGMELIDAAEKKTRLPSLMAVLLPGGDDSEVEYVFRLLCRDYGDVVHVTRKCLAQENDNRDEYMFPMLMDKKAKVKILCSRGLAFVTGRAVCFVIILGTVERMGQEMKCMLAGDYMDYLMRYVRHLNHLRSDIPTFGKIEEVRLIMSKIKMKACVEVRNWLVGEKLPTTDVLDAILNSYITSQTESGRIPDGGHVHGRATAGFVHVTQPGQKRRQESAEAAPAKRMQQASAKEAPSTCRLIKDSDVHKDIEFIMSCKSMETVKEKSNEVRTSWHVDRKRFL